MKLGELRSRVRAAKHVSVESHLGGEFDRLYTVRVQKGSLLELLGQIYGEKREAETGLVVYEAGEDSIVVGLMSAVFGNDSSGAKPAPKRSPPPPELPSEDDDLGDDTSADLLGSDEDDDMEDLL
jgi:hypothetical protein